jgi:5'-nucleotidase
MQLERIIMPTIMLTNDDGIQSVGLVALKERLEKLGKVIVVAPRDERSCVGKALTLNHIKIMETQLSDGSRAYAVTGTPADVFFLAANKILKRMPDLLVAGINLGPNLGIDDLLSSGTLGAALEAAIHHVPAIAVSYCIPKIITESTSEKKDVTVEELELAATLTFKTAKHVLEKGMPPGVDIISINVPEKAYSKIEITSLSYKGYGDIYTKQSEGYRITNWALTDYPDDEPGTDLHAVKRERCISITPIKVRLLHNKKQLEGLLKAISA